MPLDPEEIYYGVDGARQGPVSLETLRERLATGAVSQDDFVWDDDLDDWVPIRNYPALREDAGPADLDDPGLEADEVPAETSFAFAGALPRFAAWLIDAVALLLPITIWEITVESITGSPLEDIMVDPMAAPDPAAIEFLLWLHGGAAVIRGLYWSAMESSRWQATLGKKLLGLVVTDERGHRAPLRQTFVRYVGRLFCELTFGLGYLLVIFDERRQGLHDRIARTYVVKT